MANPLEILKFRLPAFTAGEVTPRENPLKDVVVDVTNQLVMEDEDVMAQAKLEYPRSTSALAPFATLADARARLKAIPLSLPKLDLAQKVFLALGVLNFLPIAAIYGLANLRVDWAETAMLLYNTEKEFVMERDHLATLAKHDTAASDAILLDIIRNPEKYQEGGRFKNSSFRIDRDSFNILANDHRFTPALQSELMDLVVSEELSFESRWRALEILNAKTELADVENLKFIIKQSGALNKLQIGTDTDIVTDRLFRIFSNHATLPPEVVLLAMAESNDLRPIRAGQSDELKTHLKKLAKSKNPQISEAAQQVLEGIEVRDNFHPSGGGY